MLAELSSPNVPLNLKIPAVTKGSGSLKPPAQPKLGFKKAILVLCVPESYWVHVLPLSRLYPVDWTGVVPVVAPFPTKIVVPGI